MPFLFLGRKWFARVFVYIFSTLGIYTLGLSVVITLPISHNITTHGYYFHWMHIATPI